MIEFEKGGPCDEPLERKISQRSCSIFDEKI